MTGYKEHLDKILDFLNAYDQVVNCHLVDFITERLWDKCLPESLKLELDENEMSIDCFSHNNDCPELNRFIGTAKSLSLESCSAVKNLKDVSNILPNDTENISLINEEERAEFMNLKKHHEVLALGNAIKTIAASVPHLVIDAGAGKAYLSTYLAERHKMPVLAIDSSKVCHKGANDRCEKLKRKKRQTQSLVQYVVEEINEETDYGKMIKENFPDWNIDKNVIITGLHTCGALAHAIIRAFLSARDINSLCLIPCCYHLTNVCFDQKYAFSKNARMLAQQSMERTTEKKFVPPSLFYRAVLQTILHSMGLYEVRVGRGGPSKDFTSYARWALEKIGVTSEKMPSVHRLEDIYQSYRDLENKFNTFQMLRIHLAPVLEAAIMLDRIIFLKDSKHCSELAVVRLFDPVLSPRRYAIFAIK